jgi:hypothetical protein
MRTLDNAAGLSFPTLAHDGNEIMREGPGNRSQAERHEQHERPIYGVWPRAMWIKCKAEDRKPGNARNDARHNRCPRAAKKRHNETEQEPGEGWSRRVHNGEHQQIDLGAATALKAPS